MLFRSAIDALYAFTDCEVSISPNACVIVADKPQFMKVNEILKYNTEQTVKLLKKELEIRKAELMEKILFSSLEKIFIEKRIYRDIEDSETFEHVITTADKGLKPYKKQFYREITRVVGILCPPSETLCLTRSIANSLLSSHKNVKQI